LPHSPPALIWIKGCPAGWLILWGMTDEKPREPEKKATKPPRPAEIWKNLEDYANDLRAIIEKLRRKLN
jgi:hypothetical protein